MSKEEQPTTGEVFAARGVSGEGGRSASQGKSSFRQSDKEKLRCTHCGGNKHTKDTCFQLVGYPEWWNENRHRQRNSNGVGTPTATPTREVAAFIHGGTSGEGQNSGEEAREVNSARGMEGEGKGFNPNRRVIPILPSPHHQISFLSSSGNSSALHVNHEKNKQWIFDCGATDTMTFDQNDIIDPSEPNRTFIKNANGGSFPVLGAGSVEISPKIKLSNCLYVPSLSCKLLSISQVTKELNCVTLIYPTFCLLQDIRSREIIGRGSERDGLYYVDELSEGGTARLAHGSQNRQIWLWHRRLGHPSDDYLKHLFPSLFSKHYRTSCDTCHFAKSHRTSFPSIENKNSVPFSLIHSDVWGPAPESMDTDFRWFVLFIDDCTRMTWVYFLKQKSDVCSRFIDFFNLVKNQFQSTIQILRSDNGGEYVNHELQTFLQKNGVIHQTTCPYTPQQNGVAERKNRHILETSRALLIESRVPSVFWFEAVASAVYLLNRLPTRALKFITPLQALSSKFTIPSILMLQPRIFGCSVFVHIPKARRTKLDPCAVKCVFLGYGIHQKGYRCFDPITKKLYVTMDCDFLETEYYYASPQSSVEGEKNNQHSDWLFKYNWEPSSTEELQSIPTNPSPLTPSSNVSEVQISDTEISDAETLSPVSVSFPNTAGQSENPYYLPPRQNRGIPPQRYNPEYKPKKSRYPIANFITCGNGQIQHFRDKLSTSWIPRNAEEAQKYPEWREAMSIEMAALRRNETWDKSRLPPGKKPVGCRWIFTIKYNPDGEVERYKARLVAKGYTQVYGIDYAETFSPVAKLDTVRVLLSVAANCDWPLHQFDVKNAFLHGDLTKTIYMEIPPGFEGEFKEGEVCRLKRSLYGLKQSPRAWFGRFTSAMKNYGYTQSNSDHTLFLKRRDSKITCLIIYVDDMIITGDDGEEIKLLQKNLFSEFEMKNLGGLKYFLGIEVMRSKEGIFLSQRKYVLDLLAETGLLDCKPTETPIAVNHGLRGDSSNRPADKEQYQRIVGKLIYLSHTRPDIAYAVGVISQFMHKPLVEHMEAAIRVIRYLKSSPGKGIFFRKNKHLGVFGYTDADWAGNITDRRSTAGYFTFVGGNLVTWRSKKQKVVALSSAEAEFRGIVKGITELLWIKKLMTEMGLLETGAFKLYCDNKAAVSISHNPVQHDRTKHIEIDRHFIKEKLDNELITLPFVRSEDQLADILTKAVSGIAFHRVLGKLGMWDPPPTNLRGSVEF